jgi:hypothetical protein
VTEIKLYYGDRTDFVFHSLSGIQNQSEAIATFIFQLSKKRTISLLYLLLLAYITLLDERFVAFG